MAFWGYFRHSVAIWTENWALQLDTYIRGGNCFSLHYSWSLIIHNRCAPYFARRNTYTRRKRRTCLLSLDEPFYVLCGIQPSLFRKPNPIDGIYASSWMKLSVSWLKGSVGVGSSSGGYQCWRGHIIRYKPIQSALYVQILYKFG